MTTFSRVSGQSFLVINVGPSFQEDFRPNLSLWFVTWIQSHNAVFGASVFPIGLFRPSHYNFVMSDRPIGTNFCVGVGNFSIQLSQYNFCSGYLNSQLRYPKQEMMQLK